MAAREETRWPESWLSTATFGTAARLGSHSPCVVMKCREAANGLEALDETRIQATDVILMDWVMPGMGGDPACRAIRAASSVPIIVVTALDREREALAAGADVFLQKPVSIHTLQAGIEAILGARGTHRE